MKLSYKLAKTMIKVIVDENPGYDYKENRDHCVYAPAGDGKRCIIGELMHRLGIDLDGYFSRIDHIDLSKFGWEVTDKAALFLKVVQAVQDRRSGLNDSTWENAYAQGVAAIESKVGNEN